MTESSVARSWRARAVALFGLLAAAACCAAESGCVQRRLTIRSNPPGAMVYVDDRQIGATPVSTNFIYYGTRKIRLVKDGYETLTVMQPVPVPWYQFVPLDFVTENLVPGDIRDQRTLDYQLVPQVVVPAEQLLARAEGLRQETHAAGMVQAAPPRSRGPAVPPGAPPGAAPGAFAPVAPSSPGSMPPASPLPGSPPPYAPAAPPSYAPNSPPAAAPSALPGEPFLPYPAEPPGGWRPRAGPDG